MTEHDRWILSFYRHSEISGAQFFARLAKTLPAGPIQHDLTKHFADESQHAWYWTKALDEMGLEPLKMTFAYQDQYLEAAGMPTNIMEILSLTQVFERRIISQYARHGRVKDVHPAIKATINTIMEDEKWHIHWVGEALKGLEESFGAERVRKTYEHYRQADEAVYERFVTEHEERIGHILDKQNYAF
ncbi:ferritin-like domain-containing protein [Ketobacter sp.]|uniref:ferritin-like domain-containing protein n=1 Tax=Ketobacter sp. TaxID=2083498 RepID=UPI000F0EA569|nr:ferritin-like domain-containing protein [Ketobacter sp.]RLT95073.1 MAG: ferritin-like domain-containing protein [Ketobacter sp.]